MKIVRFTGKFTDLIPDGWRFQKLFARNYRQYHKTCDGKPYSQDCRIWQHHGGYLEICDFNREDSAAFAELIESGKIEEYLTIIHWVTSDSYVLYPFIIDTKKHFFIPKKSPEYTEISRRLLFDNPGHEFHLQYRQWNARPELVKMIKNLFDKKWIAIEEIEDEN